MDEMDHAKRRVSTQGARPHGVIKGHAGYGIWDVDRWHLICLSHPRKRVGWSESR